MHFCNSVVNKFGCHHQTLNFKLNLNNLKFSRNLCSKTVVPCCCVSDAPFLVCRKQETPSHDSCHGGASHLHGCLVGILW